MKNKKWIGFILLLALSLGAVGCNNDKMPENKGQETVDLKDDKTEESAQETVDFKDDIPKDSALPEDFVFPVTDGSTSTTNLDKAMRNAILGGDQTVAHTKTYTSFQNLLEGKCDLIFTTPLSESQLQTMENVGFSHEAEPVAGEGFVFVVNKDNPVDTLTVEQLKGIYSGEITNWKDVGGHDAEILAYQRNSDSGSQNYMISFMGDTPLMKPVTDHVPASMSGILDVIANYDNGSNAIGYSVYAYSDGMYENISEIKYIKVNGVEPSLTTLADGSYPLLGYNYAVFSADEAEDSHVRALVKWIQSDEGQQVVANAGYIPYRRVEGLTLPEQTTRTLYTAAGTSGIKQSEETADYYYQCRKVPKTFAAEGLDEAVQAFVTEAEAYFGGIDQEKVQSFIQSRNAYDMGQGVYTRYSLINGYLSVTVGLKYNHGYQDSPDYYYDVKTAVFDIYTGKQQELSDLFFDGLDFVPLLNQHLADEAVKPFSGFGGTHDMLRDFTGLYEGEFVFTAESIIFKPGTCFADGVELSIADLNEYMVTGIPRDMSGCVGDNVPVYKNMRTYSSDKIGYGDKKDNINLWYLDQNKAPLSEDVCEKVNGFIDTLYESFFTEEKLLARARETDAAFDKVSIEPYPDFRLSLRGSRYIEFTGANTAYPRKGDGPYDISFTVVEGQYDSINFYFYFNAQTGEELRIGDLFTEGWEKHAELFLTDEGDSKWDSTAWKGYTKEIDLNNSSILMIMNYSSTPYQYADLRDLEIPVLVFVAGEKGETVAVSVPREYIK